MGGYFKLKVADKKSVIPSREHYHADYEVYYLTEGGCRYFIHDKTYALTAGDIVVIPPGWIHKVMYTTPRHSRILINCTAEYIPPSTIPFLEQTVHFPNDPATAKFVAQMYQQLKEAVLHPDAFSEDTICCSSMQLILRIVKAASYTKPLSVSSPIAEHAIAYIRNHYMDTITLTDTARHCAVSHEHLSRVFKKETGFGFKEYLNLYRLKKAESQLKSGQARSVSRVALQCGFSDSNYFSKRYKDAYGVAPSQVIKQTEQEDRHV